MITDFLGTRINERWVILELQELQCILYWWKKGRLKSHIFYLYRIFFYLLSHDCHFDIDRDVSTTVGGRNVAINIKVTIVRQTIKLNPLYTLSTMINIFMTYFIHFYLSAVIA